MRSFSKIFTGLLAFITISCATTKSSNSDQNEVKIIHDTITITQTKVDTLLVQKCDRNNSEFYISSRLPDWFKRTKLLKGLILSKNYKFDNRLNPLYLEGDFDGDKHIDIAIPIEKIDSEKTGFAIVHGKTNEIHIIGAGKSIKNRPSGDFGSTDIWKVNRSKVNKPGLEEKTGNGKKGELILKHPSIKIEKSEVGGGLIYWNGKEYAYFHQSC